MASTFIKVNGTGPMHNQQMRAFVDKLRAVQQDCIRLKEIFDQAAMGGDWVALGAVLDVSPTDAETIYNLLGSVKTELTATFITQMVGRLG